MSLTRYRFSMLFYIIYPWFWIMGLTRYRSSMLFYMIYPCSVKWFVQCAGFTYNVNIMNNSKAMQTVM